MDALVSKTEIQYPNPDKKPANLPNPSRGNIYGPPVFGTSLLSRPKTAATASAPNPDAIQPKNDMPPNGASAAGRIKIPEPIILPTTSEVTIQNPICFCEFVGIVFGKITI